MAAQQDQQYSRSPYDKRFPMSLLPPNLLRLALAICVMTVPACVTPKGESAGELSVLKTVSVVFGYDDISVGKVRSLDKATLQSIGHYFTPPLREKMEAFVKIETSIPKGGSPEVNSIPRNEADLMMTCDPVTNRFNKPNAVRIGKAEYVGTAALVTVTDIYREMGGFDGRKKAVVTLVPGPTHWRISEVRFETRDKVKSFTLSDSLEDLSRRLNGLRKRWGGS